MKKQSSRAFPYHLISTFLIIKSSRLKFIVMDYFPELF